MWLPRHQTGVGDSLLLGSHWHWTLDMPSLPFCLSQLLVWIRRSTYNQCCYPAIKRRKETVCCLVHTGNGLSICLLFRFFCPSSWYESDEELTTNVATLPSNGGRRQSAAWFTLALTSRYASSYISSVSAPGMNQTKHLQPMWLPCHQTGEGDSLCCLVHTGNDLSICLLFRFFCLSSSVVWIRRSIRNQCGYLAIKDTSIKNLLKICDSVS